jgi:uncharacterized delta-60 repeat protein
MWSTFLSLCFTLTGNTPRRPAPRRRPPFRCLTSRPHIEGLEDRCLLSAGALDSTFGNGAGYVTTSLSSGNDIARVALIQPADGKVVVTGEANPATGRNFAVARYNTSGSLDTSFGTGGTAQASFASFNSGSPLYPADDYAGAALQPDGKIVVAGWDRFNIISKKKVVGVQGAFILARFTTSGTLDPTFGTGGEVATTFPNIPTGTMVYGEGGVVATSAGKIVMAGDAGSDFILVRYNANGSLDTTFGSGGEVFSSWPQFPSLGARALLQQPDGKLIVVGDTNGAAPNDWVLACYNANGTLDTSFGNQGVVVTPLSGEVGSGGTGGGGAALYPIAGTPNDGKIVVVGSDDSTGTWQTVRYNANGSLDATFGSGGVVVTQISGNPISVALDATGRPVATGFNGGATELARFNLDGTPDTTFGSGGLVITQVSSNSQGRGIAIYPSTDTTGNVGKIVVVGNSNGTNDDFLVARYLPSAPKVGSFTASPNPVTSGSSTTLTATNITDGNPNSTVTQVAFYAQVNGTNTLLGYGTQTSPGAWTFSYAVNLAPGTYTLFAQAQDSDGVLGDLVPLTPTVQ